MNRKEFLRGAAGAAAMAALGGAGLGMAAEAAPAQEAEGLEGSVRLLLDRAEISECQYRYARGADNWDEALLASAFDETISTLYPTSSAEDIPGASMARGIVGNFSANGIVTQHYMNVYEIKVDGDSAQALVYLRATHMKEGAAPYIVGGFYENTYVRREDGWKIKTVKLNYTYEEGESYFGENVTKFK